MYDVRCTMSLPVHFMLSLNVSGDIARVCAVPLTRVSSGVELNAVSAVHISPAEQAKGTMAFSVQPQATRRCTPCATHYSLQQQSVWYLFSPRVRERRRPNLQHQHVSSTSSSSSSQTARPITRQIDSTASSRFDPRYPLHTIADPSVTYSLFTATFISRSTLLTCINQLN